MQSRGLIRDLELQPKFDLLITPMAATGLASQQKKVGFYKADFRYFNKETERVVIEDVKGMKTPIYNLKKKMVEALYGVEIVEVR